MSPAEERTAMDQMYSEDVQLPPGTQVEGHLPVVEDWEDDSDE